MSITIHYTLPRDETVQEFTHDTARSRDEAIAALLDKHPTAEITQDAPNASAASAPVAEEPDSASMSKSGWMPKTLRVLAIGGPILYMIYLASIVSEANLPNSGSILFQSLIMASLGGFCVYVVAHVVDLLEQQGRYLADLAKRG